MKNRLSIPAVAITLLASGCDERPEPLTPRGAVPEGPSHSVQLQVPADHPGNPFYALIFNGFDPEGPHFFFPHSDEWGAAIFERDLGCVPPDFNLLEEFDFTPAFPGGPPRPFLCRLTVNGFQVWEEAPGSEPVEGGPIFVMSRGLGHVPVVFARWSEIEAAMSDMVLTLPELLELPSAMVGSADRFIGVYANGAPPEHRLMNKVSASGTLPDGREFRIAANESENGTRYQVKMW